MAFDGRLLAGVGVLAAVIEARGFARAGEGLGLSASGVSRAIARLEARVGVRLLDRTTRQVRLTDEGRRFYEQAAPLLAGLEEAVDEAAGSAGAVRGRLRVNADPFFTSVFLAHHLAGFLARYPELSLDLITRDQVGDLVAEGFDIAVRFGEPTVPSLVARRLAQTRILTVASPAYLARHGRPERPEDVADHECIGFRDPATGRPFEWEFQRGGEVLPVRPRGRLYLSEASALLGAVLSGAGIAQVMALAVQPQMASGELVELFPAWDGETFPLYALHASRSLPAAKVRAFVDFCAEVLAGRP